jgi:hypothetical protein
MKKTYTAPAIKVRKIETESILAASDPALHNQEGHDEGSAKSNAFGNEDYNNLNVNVWGESDEN